jgi:hypothetical protein
MGGSLQKCQRRGYTKMSSDCCAPGADPRAYVRDAYAKTVNRDCSDDNES